MPVDHLSTHHPIYMNLTLTNQYRSLSALNLYFFQLQSMLGYIKTSEYSLVLTRSTKQSQFIDWLSTVVRVWSRRCHGTPTRNAQVVSSWQEEYTTGLGPSPAQGWTHCCPSESYRWHTGQSSPTTPFFNPDSYFSRNFIKSLWFLRCSLVNFRSHNSHQ